jgi:hypothetical protein
LRFTTKLAALRFTTKLSASDTTLPLTERGTTIQNKHQLLEAGQDDKMSLFTTGGVGFCRGVVLFMSALTMLVLYTHQVSLMFSYKMIADQRQLYTKETSVPQKGIIHGITDSVAPYFQDRENETIVLLEEEFAKFRKRDAELNIHSANHSFSSCLLIMDENHRLTEWLAYHIHALPLQHIVVANDPRSQTDPNIVFDKFRRLGLKIEVWNDTDFGFDRDWQSAEQNGDSNALINIHRKRQVTFYKQCSNYLKTQNRSWTTFHDVDEYIVLDKHYINNTDTRLQQPGSILKWFQEARQTKPVDIEKQYWTKDCITLSRTMYGTHPSNISEIEKDVPAFLNASKFETLVCLAAACIFCASHDLSRLTFSFCVPVSCTLFLKSGVSSP